MFRKHCRPMVLALLAFAFPLFALVTCSAPTTKVLDGPIVEEMKEGRATGTQVFDHGPLDTLLNEHVDGQTSRVDYAGLKADEADLDAYLARIAGAQMQDLGADEQH